MLKHTLLSLVLAASLTGCVTYGTQHFNPTPEQSAAMEADSRAVQAAERAERREEMMDEADAINRAYGNRKVYILH